MNSSTTTFVYVTYILSTPEKVFEAISNPDLARQYWGHNIVSDWVPGSNWELIRDNDARTVSIAGKVIENAPPKRRVVTWGRPSDFPDASKHSRVTLDLEPIENMVRLTVTHDELVEGSEFARDIANGWPRVFSSLKSFLETGRPINVFAQMQLG